MPFTMYSASVPVLVAMLGSLDHLLDKAQAFVLEKKCEPEALTHFRLAPDMFAFIRQVQIACDTAKNGVSRLSGVVAPKFADDERTLSELRDRIQKTVEYLHTVPASTFDGSDLREVTYPIGREMTRTLPGDAYLTQSVLPNFYFHLTTAYNILRHNGVEIGKRDYLPGARG